MLNPDQAAELQNIADDLMEQLLRLGKALDKIPPETKGLKRVRILHDRLFEFIDDIADVYIFDEVVRSGTIRPVVVK